MQAFSTNTKAIKTNAPKETRYPLEALLAAYYENLSDHICRSDILLQVVVSAKFDLVNNQNLDIKKASNIIVY